MENPKTIATAIRIGNPASWKMAVDAAGESHGAIDMVTDEEILEAYSMLASLEGVFCEAASAAAIAGVIKKNKEGMFSGGEGSLYPYRTWTQGHRDGNKPVYEAGNSQGG